MIVNYKSLFFFRRNYYDSYYSHCPALCPPVKVYRSSQTSSPDILYQAQVDYQQSLYPWSNNSKIWLQIFPLFSTLLAIIS